MLLKRTALLIVARISLLKRNVVEMRVFDELIAVCFSFINDTRIQHLFESVGIPWNIPQNLISRSVT